MTSRSLLLLGELDRGAGGSLAEVLFAIAGWVDWMESQRRSERVKARLAGVRTKGKKLRRPKGSQGNHKRK